MVDNNNKNVASVDGHNRSLEVEKEINDLFDKQALQFHDQLKWTQEVHNKTRTQNEIDTDNINAIMAAEKRDRDVKQHEQWANQEAHEVQFTLTHDFMTENPATEVSMLAPHRVKPYHFKGFNQGQID